MSNYYVDPEGRVVQEVTAVDNTAFETCNNCMYAKFGGLGGGALCLTRRPVETQRYSCQDVYYVEVTNAER